MFQIISTLMEEVPAFALRMRELQGESPNVQLKDNPWGHVEHCDANCTCLESDRTGAYVHCLLPMPGTSDSTSLNDDEVSVEVENGFTFNNDCGYLLEPYAGLKVWPATAPPCNEEARTRTAIQCGGPHRTANFYI